MWPDCDKTVIDMVRDAKQTILIVDDVETDVDTLVETLGDDYEIAVALDGPTALESLAPNPPDLILLDILMPGMDGYEVCRRLKADPATAAIPVIFLTALTEVQEKVTGFALGAVDYITKPFDIQEVKARVTTHLALKAAMEQLARQNTLLAEAARLREDVERITHHDLKGPLGVILSLPQLIAVGGNLTGEQAGYLEDIEEAGYQMLNMVNLSLGLLKMEQGVYELSPRLVDIVRVIGKVVAELASLRRARGVSVELRREGTPLTSDVAVHVVGEELLCHSMLSNLVKNAIEHSPAGGRVDIDIAPAKDGFRALALRNLGETDPGFRERFFEKYATHGKPGGTGLGTYSARLMARTMGGDLLLDAATPGETTLALCLPAPRT
ncbi:hybrid sensor histidine kinase/response regulator [Solidesulfovibrio carbinolicus]|uniref:histidine kinase n=1 Tax=Solidesulfovibrio carbinolicus TaxID=296842 RepID=A0A4P6HJF4_9BACT|nr:hybrid sensor histidine kinase/response regulator [Solidesulfovibrio carbinolicus]QAZ66985.1 hybrid sensor histidine kinase/response regulator [Solidesulfovibrio carbinolicus]